MTAFGAPHRHHRVTDSTNARLRDLALAGAPGGTVLTAAEQSAGRGRQGRSWFAPEGGALLYSALLRPLGERPLLPLAVPLAVCEAAERLAGVECRVKWPNDVWIEGRKLAGVLIESRAGDDGWAVIGVGLNVGIPNAGFPEELRHTAVSLFPSPGQAPELPVVRGALDAALGRWVDEPAEGILREFRARDALEGMDVAWSDGEGVAAGIDEAGHLLVETSGGEVKLGAGEVHLRFPGRA